MKKKLILGPGVAHRFHYPTHLSACQPLSICLKGRNLFPWQNLVKEAERKTKLHPENCHLCNETL
jgi:hypothetical protein